MHFPRKRLLLSILAGLILLILVARAVAPGIVLKKLNAYLGSFSPLYALHISDLDLHVWRMAYSFENAEGTLKKDGERFMSIERVNVSLAWREIFRGRVVADVDLHRVGLKLTNASLDALSGVGVDQAKDDAKNVKEATVPFNLERLRVTDSGFEFSDVAGLPPEQALRLSRIDALVSNLTPTDAKSLTLYTFSGSIQETADIKGVGQMHLKAEPAEWNVNIETRDFELKTLNPVASRMVPVSFKSGQLTVFIAAQSVKGNLKGYVKPFINDLTFIGDRKDFRNVGQFFIEIAGTIGNFFLKNKDSRALATKVSFEKKGSAPMVTDTGKAVSLAIKNAFGAGLKQSFDETYELE